MDLVMEPQPEQTLAQAAERVRLMEAVLAEYQETRHSLKNVLAVIMAMAELTERNPGYAPKLINCILEKGPEMVQHMEALTRTFEKMRDGTE